MKDYRNFRSLDLSIITAFLAAGIVAVIACQEEESEYVPSSCHWQERAIDSLDAYLDAEEGPATEEALRTTDALLSLAVMAKHREDRDGLELVCNKTTESLEQSIQKMTDRVQASRR